MFKVIQTFRFLNPSIFPKIWLIKTVEGKRGGFSFSNEDHKVSY